jgi:hypothetical protein
MGTEKGREYRERTDYQNAPAWRAEEDEMVLKLKE